MILETERLLVRPFTMEDAADLQAILGDPETMTFVEPPYDPERTAAFLRDFCIGRGGALAAALKSGGPVIGYLLFHAVEPDVYEMGWIFHRGYWRQGYAYEACAALMKHAFEELGAHKVFAETVDPVKSAGLMRKLGMRPEGAQRESVSEQEGRWQELHVYSMLAKEYFSHYKE